MSLAEVFQDEAKKKAVIADAEKLVDEEVASKSGLSGFAVKKGFEAVKGIKPGFIREVLDKLLPEFAEKIDPLWVEGQKAGDPTSFFEKNRGRVADSLLSVTDGKIDRAKSSMVRSTYSMLRGSAKKHVEDAVPRLAKLVAKHAL
jgi:hypothetical protein